ncbi:lipid hydroperoxide peroxidase [Salinisphaera orenii MK-B5]|uniref:Thiol peroxidase n=2 Tax=Salinisphaera orenii TaxID=856731 RepID=A0A423PSW8_9GAMM|nr:MULTISPECIES: thiol peroxidase [Salinisphaera]ROO25881.1 lipid hydroperoxide peroxidase [Salinisphaera halophila YIM 95161]ROO28699.1 lipid hydroperoxide peroxidase [Salinisphaera orenii MK-B5]
MTQSITLRGTPASVAGALPAPGDRLPDFTLTGTDLGDRHLADFAGQRKILNIFPSLDTPTCALSVKRFNADVEALDNVALLQVSADLPFAHSRFCSAEGLANGVTLSMMRDKSFAEDYGVLMADGPMAGLCARAVVVADADDRVLHSELVGEISDEPDYAAALAALAG